MFTRVIIYYKQERMKKNRRQPNVDSYIDFMCAAISLYLSISWGMVNKLCQTECRRKLFPSKR